MPRIEGVAVKNYWVLADVSLGTTIGAGSDPLPPMLALGSLWYSNHFAHGHP